MTGIATYLLERRSSSRLRLPLFGCRPSNCSATHTSRINRSSSSSKVAKDDIIGIVAHRIGDAAVMRSDHHLDLRSDHIRQRKLAKSLGFQG